MWGWWSRGQLWGIGILKEGRLQIGNGNGLSLTMDIDDVVLLWTGWMLDCGFDGAFEDWKKGPS